MCNIRLFYIFVFGALIIGYSSTLFTKIMSFSRCNLYLMNGINIPLINKTILLSKNLIYKYGIKKGRIKTKIKPIISAIVTLWPNISGYIFIKASISFNDITSIEYRVYYPINISQKNNGLSLTKCCRYT